MDNHIAELQSCAKALDLTEEAYLALYRFKDKSFAALSSSDADKLLMLADLHEGLTPSDIERRQRSGQISLPADDTYRHDTDDAREICELIGWRFDTKPIETKRQDGSVLLTGTLLKQREWHRLVADYPLTLSDGTPVYLRGVPREIMRNR